MIIRDEHKELLEIDLDGNITTDDLGQMKAYLIKKRKKLVQPYKDFKQRSAGKSAWRHGRYSHLKGIRAFTHSVAGKRFHRRLGQFLARNAMYYGVQKESLDRYEVVELLTNLNSYRTHLFIELKYYSPFFEELDFLLGAQEVLEFLDELTVDIFNHIAKYESFEIDHEIFDGIVRILDFDGLLKVLSEMSNKSIDEVIAVWKKAEGAAYETYSIRENHNTFYSKTLGITCKLLAVSKNFEENDDESEIDG